MAADLLHPHAPQHRSGRPIVLAVLATLTALLLSGLLGASPTPASAQSGADEPFECGPSSAWLVSGSINAPNGPQDLQLYSVHPETAALTPIGPGGLDANALAFNPADNYLYGMGYHGGPGESGSFLYRISADGTATNLGIPTGLGANSPERKIYAGTFLPNGNYLISRETEDGAGTAIASNLIEIDVATTSVVSVWPVQHRSGDYFDLAVEPSTGRIFAHRRSDNSLVEIAYGTGTTTVVNAGPMPFSAAGSSWFTADGAHWFFGNEAGQSNSQNILYRASSASATPVLVDYGPTVTGSDGASCAFATTMDKTVSASPVVAGTEVTYTFTITNRAPDPITVDFADSMADGRTFVPGSETSTGGGTFTYSAGDTEVRAPDLVVPAATWVPGSGTVTPGTATVTIDVDTTGVAPGTVLNQAVIRASNNPNEPVVSNWPDNDPDDDGPDPTPLEVIVPAIQIDKQVEDPNAPGSFVESAEYRTGEPVTFRISVTNTGSTGLTDVAVTDALGPACAGTLGSLAADASTSYTCTVAGGYTADTVNTAAVTGQPPVGPVVGDDDPATVTVADPSITIAKTVYRGHDSGAGCPAGELVSDVVDAAVTYCFVITNTGDATLDASVDDTDLGITDGDMRVVSGALADLAPDASATLYHETTITADLTNTASTTGVTAGGTTVGDEDSARVDLVRPAITIDKTVYRGHDDGQGCAGVDLVDGFAGDDVTYCFTVTNTGDTVLAPVTVRDDDLGIDESDMWALSGDLSSMAPDAVTTLFVEATIDGELLNTAVAGGNPADGQGADLPGLADVADDDTALVAEITPGIDVDKTVVAGHDGGRSCPGDELVRGERGQPVTYCFTVTNTGTARLTPVTLVDDDLGITDADMTTIDGSLDSLAPDESASLYVEATIDGDLVNTVTATGIPVDGIGSPAAAFPHGVNATDDAEVREMTARIGVAKTVSAGPVANGDGSYTLTYAIDVQNTGEIDLSALQLTDDLEETFAGAVGFTVDEVTSDRLTANWPGFDGRATGDPQLLAGTDQLTVGQRASVRLTLTVTPGAKLGPYLNTAIGWGRTPLGETVGDLSDSGTDSRPSRTNPGQPGDTGGSDDPVPTSFPPLDSPSDDPDPTTDPVPAVDPTDPTGLLARTGANALRLALIGLGLVMGGLLIDRARRRT